MAAYYKYPKLSSRELKKYELEFEKNNSIIIFNHIPTQQEVDKWIDEKKAILIPDLPSREFSTYEELLSDFELNNNLEFDAIYCL